MKLSRIFKKQLKLIDKRIKELITANDAQIMSVKKFRASVNKLYEDAIKGEAK